MTSPPKNARPPTKSLDKMDSNPTSLKSQSAWLLFAKVVGFAISFLLPLLVVRYFSQEQVGVYRQVFLVITTANAIIPLGFGASAFYFLSRETARRPSVIANTLVFNFVVGAAAFLTLYFYPQLLGNIFQSDELTQFAPKIGVIIWLWIFSTFLDTVAIANREAKTATALIIFAQLTKTIFMVTAVIIFTTVESFIYAAMAQAFLQSIVLLAYANSRFPTFWTAFDFQFLRRQLFYALPFGLAGLFWTLQYDVHNYFVGYRFTHAEFAIYSYGCFELPLIGMLMESVTAVLIPRMSELQSRDDRPEMLRLLTRTMQKLAFFYFPIYIFLMITAQTFVTTLFTRNYAASVPIFVINITLIPSYIMVNDSIIRAYQELGRFLLILRVFIFVGLISALYFGIQHFDLRGMIAIVVVTSLIDRLVSAAVVIKKVGAGKRDLPLLTDVGKTALASLFAGVFTYVFYWQFQSAIFDWSVNFINTVFPLSKDSLVNFLAGSAVLASCALIFAPLYLLSANFFGIIETSEKEKIREFWRKVLRRSVEPLPLTSEK
ncbi:MAG: oligosaccharide flippase family protein [Acidobacteriota bacterium]|nr:oligosaccharide flippase family protein [Acidobacteriota bacterium]